MKKLLTVILLLAFIALVLRGINAATAATHEIMGDTAYRPFFNFQELFQ